MSITSELNLGLPAAPLARDPHMAAELTIVYRALHILQQVLNDAGIPAGGSSPSPSAVDVPHGGTGVITIKGVVVGHDTAAFSAVTSTTVGHILKCTGANAFAFGAPDTAANSNQLESKTWEAPGTIGSTTPNTIKGTTVQATSAAGFKSSDGSAGYTGTLTTASLVGKTVTIKDGIITNIA